MLDLIYINFLREKVRLLEGGQAPGAVLGSTARERYVPSTKPEHSPLRPTTRIVGVVENVAEPALSPIQRLP
jgi:hypothetical protein